METNDSLIGATALEEAIERHLLTVTPDTLLVDAIALMNQKRASSCSLSFNDSPKKDDLPKLQSCSSCVLVTDESKLLGIFTERDIVFLTADGLNFEGVKIAEVMTQPVTTLSEANFKDIFAPLFLFRRYRIRHLPIVDAQDQLVGIVSPESIRQVLKPANLLKLRRVSDVMTKQVIHAPMNASVLSIARLMRKHRVSCVVLLEEDPEFDFRPVGIITERDIVQFQALELELSKIQAQNVMSTPLFLLNPEDSLATAHQEMQSRHVRRLVVSWNWGRDLGIVTQTSLLRVFDPMEMYGVIETLQCTIQELEGREAQISAIPTPKPSQKQKQIHSLSFSPQKPLDLSPSNWNRDCEPDLNMLLSTLQVSLESLINEPNLSPELRQIRLNSALAEVQGIRQLIEREGRGQKLQHMA
ncbi:MAG: CBS domain-containing protein [Moorea sp. SIO2B7]|nr:CBS domain-containing protein [Moorena sp. SIO2B7]